LRKPRARRPGLSMLPRAGAPPCLIGHGGETLLYAIKAGPAGGRLRRPSSAGMYQRDRQHWEQEADDPRQRRRLEGHCDGHRCPFNNRKRLACGGRDQKCLTRAARNYCCYNNRHTLTILLAVAALATRAKEFTLSGLYSGNSNYGLDRARGRLDARRCDQHANLQNAND